MSCCSFYRQRNTFSPNPGKKKWHGSQLNRGSCFDYLTNIQDYNVLCSHIHIWSISKILLGPPFQESLHFLWGNMCTFISYSTPPHTLHCYINKWLILLTFHIDMLHSFSPSPSSLRSHLIRETFLTEAALAFTLLYLLCSALSSYHFINLLYIFLYASV